MTHIPNFHPVCEGLYRSGILDKHNIQEVLDYGIKSIISMKTDPLDTKIERAFCKKHGLNFIHIPIVIIMYTHEEKCNFWDVYHNMKLLPQPVLVHCTHGSDRTGIAIAMHRLLVDRWPLEQVYEEMDKYGFKPLLGFWKKFLEEVEASRLS